MSWKLFIQIVLLIVITAVVMFSTKYCLYSKCGLGKKFMRMHHSIQK